jgi:hypothetical protein
MDNQLSKESEGRLAWAIEMLAREVLAQAPAAALVTISIEAGFSPMGVGGMAVRVTTVGMPKDKPADKKAPLDAAEEVSKLLKDLNKKQEPPKAPEV